MSKPRTIAIAQGGGPTAVINSQLAGAIFEAKSNKIERIFGVRNGLEGLLDINDENVIDISDWNPITLKNIPGAVLGTTRVKLDVSEDVDKIQKIKDNLKRLSVD